MAKREQKSFDRLDLYSFQRLIWTCCFFLLCEAFSILLFCFYRSQGIYFVLSARKNVTYSVLGGAVAQYGGYSAAFSLAASLNIFLILYVIFYLREPEDDNLRSKGSATLCRRMLNWDFLRDMFSLVRWIYNDVRARTCIFVAGICLWIAWMVSTGPNLCLFSVFHGKKTLLCTGTNEVRYNFIKARNPQWDVLEFNLLAAEDAFIRSLTLITILPLMKHYFRLRDSIIIVLGFGSKMVMLIVYAVSFNTMMIYLGKCRNGDDEFIRIYDNLKDSGKKIVANLLIT